MVHRRTFVGWIWGWLAAIALLWPDRLSGLLDGVPLDRPLEAALIGVVFPALWWFHPRFLATRFARAGIALLICWKVFSAATLAQDGWCARFVTAAPLVRDSSGAPHSWDLRADWRAPDPVCSAIITRSYNDLAEFPVWFFNLPPASDSWPGPGDRPPGAAITLTVDGFLHADTPGSLTLVVGPGVATTASADGGSPSGGSGTSPVVAVDRGIHAISVNARLTGDRWQFAPEWNGADLWASSMATRTRPSRLDLAVRPWGAWVTTTMAAMLLAGWVAFALAQMADPDVLAWVAGAVGCLGLLAATGQGDIVRWSVAGLAGAALLPIAARRRNLGGAFAVIGIPWLTLIVALGMPAVGRVRLYDVGSDFWMYQRYAYRIFMQGYWFEGGSSTFWFQPFYRWIVSALHPIFGDSSVGEWYWDGACALAAALFSYHITRTFAGFRWGIVAGAMTLTVFARDPTWGFVGRGLSEISSAGLVSLAALFALRSRTGRWRAAIAAGLFASLAFLTRMNNLPMALAVVVFALPLRVPIRTAFRPSVWWPRASKPTLLIVAGSLCAALLVLAFHSWRYTGVFSVLYGTQASSLAVWKTGMSLPTVVSRMADSSMMVLTMNDPPRVDVHGVPLLAGVALSVLAVLGVPLLRDLPMAPVLFCLAGISGSLIARGSAYTGRFSIHMIAICCAIVTCAAARIVRSVRRVRIDALE